MINLDSMNQVIDELATLSKSMRNASETLEGIEKNRAELETISEELKQQNKTAEETQKLFETIVRENRATNEMSKTVLDSINAEVQASLKEMLQAQTRSYNDYMLAIGQKADFVNEQIKSLNNSIKQESVNQIGRIDTLCTKIAAIAKLQKLLMGFGAVAIIISVLSFII